MTGSNQRIYLDHSATTPLDPRVKAVIDKHLSSTYGNASSIHRMGREAKVVLEESREVIAKSINAEPSEIFFTSGGTESDNQAVVGVALAHRRELQKNHIIVSSIEHHAVLDCCGYLTQLGFEVSCIKVNSEGVVDVNQLENAINPRTALISVMQANNETGVFQPIERIGAIGRDHRILIHTDAVQTFGKIPLDVHAIGVDLLSVSAHKINGPKGIGALYIRKGTLIDALIHGGSQERKNRAGTENIPLIAGFAAAVHITMEESGETLKHVSSLHTTLRDMISKNLDGIVFNTPEQNTLPYILNVSLDARYYDVESESLLLNMDLGGIEVSSGSACTSGSIQPSHVLEAMGRDKRTTQATIRFSFGKSNTIQEVAKAGELFCSLARKFKRN